MILYVILLLSDGAAVHPDVQTVIELLFIPQILFAGFFIRTTFIPVFLRWAQWLCSLKYTVNFLQHLGGGLQQLQGRAGRPLRQHHALRAGLHAAHYRPLYSDQEGQALLLPVGRPRGR